MKKYFVSAGWNSWSLPDHYKESTTDEQIIKDFFDSVLYMTDSTLLSTESEEEARRFYASTHGDYQIDATGAGYELSIYVIDLSVEEGEYDEDGDWCSDKITIIDKKAW